MKNETIQKLKNKALKLPLSPGVYIMRDNTGKVIYVGKAKQLKNRVSQYFNSLSGQTEKVRRMVAKIADFDYFVTATEMEALLLENSQIKLYMPYYNILLKDSKTYPYLKIDLNRAFPKVEITRRRLDDGARYFGPFSGSAKQIAETVNKTFMLPTCKREFPRDTGKYRPCINKDLGLCSAPCSINCSKEEYMEAVGSAVAFLQGDLSAVTGGLTKKMQAASESMQYEKAAYYRDRLNAINKLQIKQKVVAAPDVNRDIIGFSGNAFRFVAEVFFVRGGRISDRQSYDFDADSAQDIPSFLHQFLTQLYSARADIPPQVLCPQEPYEMQLIEEYLTEKRGKKAELIVPQKGEKKKLCDLVSANAAETLRLLMTKEEKVQKSLTELSRLLSLPAPPMLIEAVDISNTAGADTVAALISFKNGEKNKSGYRHYKIKTVQGQDDYASMSEVIVRRFARAMSGEDSRPLPELLLLDGGAGHLSVISEVLTKMDINIPVFGMVKDEHHRTRALVGKEGEIALKQGTPAAVLIGRIQEEVHRFAIEYHRKKRSAGLTVTKLLQAEGVGEKRARALIVRFGSLKALGEAELNDIMQVPGMTKNTAEEVYRLFHRK